MKATFLTNQIPPKMGRQPPAKNILQRLNAHQIRKRGERIESKQYASLAATLQNNKMQNYFSASILQQSKVLKMPPTERTHEVIPESN